MVESLIDRIVQAQGGRERWTASSRVMASFSMGGAEFMSHLQPRPFRGVDVALDVRNFSATFAPFPETGLTGVFEPRRVRVENDAGEIVSDRPTPGPVTRSLRHWMVWDSLDLLFVAGVILWHSLLLPLLLCRVGVGADEVTGGKGSTDHWERLGVHFPGDVPLPSSRLQLHVDSRGLVRQVDYSPQAYGGLIRVAQEVAGYESFDGLLFPTRHSLYPCPLAGQPWRGARLAWLEFDDVRAPQAGTAGPLPEQQRGRG
jgi:hypothetical protein